MSESASLVHRWSRRDDGEDVRVVAVASFGGGRRVHVKAERRVKRHTGTSSYTIGVPFEWIADAATGETIAGERAPWHPPESEIARAKAAAGVDVLALRAATRDGLLLFFLLGRDWEEVPDPDAGSVVQCTASLGLWDVRRGAFRWETSKTLDEMGGGSWLFGHGSFELSFDESGVFGLVHLVRTKMVYDLADGSPRRARDTDGLPEVTTAEGKRLTIAAADRERKTVIVLDGTRVERWDVASRRLTASVDLGEAGDTPKAATFLDPTAAVVVGTEGGRLVRFDL